MKKLLFTIIIFFIILLLIEIISSSDVNNKKGNNKPKIVTTFTIIADIARNIAGNKLIVESITKPGAEIHDYKPTPKDLLKAQSAKVILWNGLNLERWFKKFLLDLGNVRSFTVTEGIEPLSIYEGPYTGKANPHAWMSPNNALIYIENIKKIFSKIDPKNSHYYQANADSYKKKVLNLKLRIEKSLASIPKEKRWLVTSEGAFSYLARDLGFKELYLWPINADRQGTPQQMRKLIEKIERFSIPVLFSESTISDRTAKRVAIETGAIYGGVLYVDSLSKKEGPVPSYLDLLAVTTKTIVNGFKKAKIINE